jgi:hypothetical protein
MNLEKNSSAAFLLLLIFIISRICLVTILNIQFEYDWVFQMWHFIDAELLKTKMFESIYYFHYQPPLFNLLLGLIHKQSLIPSDIVLRIFFYSLTYVIGLIIYVTSAKFTHKKVVGVILAALFYFFPETIIYENWPIYTWTSSFLLVAGFYFLNNFVIDNQKKYLVLFFLSQLVLILTRSAFHPIFFLSWFLILLIAFKHKAKMVVTSFLPSLIILLLVCLKNFSLFGFFGVGSGLGFSMYKIAPKEIDGVSISQKLDLNSEFRIVPVKSISTYGYKDKPIPPGLEGIEILTREHKSTYGKFTEEFSVNLGNFHYLEIAKKYQDSAIKIIKKYPKEYMKRVLRGIIMFFKPTWDHGFGVTHNASSLKGYINITTLGDFRLWVENLFLRGDKPWPLKSEIAYSSYLVVPIFYCFIFIMMFRLSLINTVNVQYLFVVFCSVYLFSVSNLIELAENDRYRVMLDPLVYLASCHIFLRFRRRNNATKN